MYYKNMEDTDTLLTVSEISEQFGIAPGTWRGWIRNSRLRKGKSPFAPLPEEKDYTIFNGVYRPRWRKSVVIEYMRKRQLRQRRY